MSYSGGYIKCKLNFNPNNKKLKITCQIQIIYLKK